MKIKKKKVSLDKAQKRQKKKENVSDWRNIGESEQFNLFEYWVWKPMGELFYFVGYVLGGS